MVKDLIDGLLDCKGRIQDIFNEMEELEESLIGAEINYQGNYASIMYLDSRKENACLYVEDEEGESWEVYLPLEELI